MKRLKPENFEISVKYLKKQNFAPADAMRRWAAENYETFYCNIYGEPYIRLFGAAYYYECWKISENNDDTITVTLTLKRVEE